MWKEIVEQKEKWIGGILEEFPDPPFSESLQTVIQNIKLFDEDGDTILMFECADFDECFNIKYGGVVAGEEGWITFSVMYCPGFRIKEKV
jgi:hypothetical protein